ncbi:MAG: hypothetical protein PF574_10685 [Candidatus Delongbacteria bacterium]|jgi:prefoldin subunit 5|nr:hypothetical protein [Candidatus Delongbacteria bacterium]
MNKDRSLVDIEKTFYEVMSKNSVFSSLGRIAKEIEDLKESTDNLTKEIRIASTSSTKLSKSLNLLTFALVFIAAITFIYGIYFK